MEGVGPSLETHAHTVTHERHNHRLFLGGSFARYTQTSVPYAADVSAGPEDRVTTTEQLVRGETTVGVGWVGGGGKAGRGERGSGQWWWSSGGQRRRRRLEEKKVRGPPSSGLGKWSPLLLTPTDPSPAPRFRPGHPLPRASGDLCVDTGRPRPPPSSSRRECTGGRALDAPDRARQGGAGGFGRPPRASGRQGFRSHPVR